MNRFFPKEPLADSTPFERPRDFGDGVAIENLNLPVAAVSDERRPNLWRRVGVIDYNLIQNFDRLTI